VDAADPRMETRTAAERAALQREQVKDGCFFVIGWMVIIGGALALHSGIEVILRRVVPPAGADVIVYIPFRLVTNEMFAFVFFFPAILLFGVATLDSSRMWRFAAAIFIVGVAGLAWTEWYGRFAALTLERESVVLHYLWPRSSVRVVRAEIFSTDSIRSLRYAMPTGIDVYALKLETACGAYFSYADASREDVDKVRRSLGRETPMRSR
jgi:hypothetical protein